jgi:arylsulfatase A-like enzyme
MNDRGSLANIQTREKVMKRITLASCLAALVMALCVGMAAAEGAGTPVDRTVLPPQAPEFKGKIGKTYKESTPDFSPALPLNAPKGAPNILVIMLDDVGFGQLGAYGGPIETPNIDQLAKSGIQYTNFHTTALCSPSRGALLTGRDHHEIALSAITEAATGYPNNFGSIPKSAATIAEILKQNGYNTFAIGKWHLAPYTSYTAAGPFDRWPLGMGFEKYYGFIGGETDQFAPLLVQDNSFLDRVFSKDYSLGGDLVDHAISYIRDQQQANTGRPFFAYLAFGAAHAPLAAPESYIAKYKGRFDAGWDEVRKETWQRQLKTGVIPEGTELPPPNPGVALWSSLNDTQKTVYRRLQEVFAGYLDYTDFEIGRLLKTLDEMDIRKDTVIILLSDNGASQEGGESGTANTDRFRNYTPDSAEEMLSLIDKLGGPESDAHYPRGWSMAGNSPLKRWKQDTHAGGNTDPLIISWPGHVPEGGTFRRQYHHVNDIVPTILDITGIPMPTSVNGVMQMPLSGINMDYTFKDPGAPTKKHEQEYEMLGSRAIWRDGWTAVVWHKQGTPYEEDKWELYHTDVDFSQAHDLADKMPAKLKELQAAFEEQAKANGLYPLDDRRYERVADPTRPVAAISKPQYTYYPGTSVVHPLAAPQLLGRAHTVTAKVTIPEAGAEGVLAMAGGEFGGWSFFLKDGHLHYVHNYLKLKEFDVVSNTAIAPGDHELSFTFEPTSASKKPDYFIGNIKLFADGKQVGAMDDVKMAGQYSSVTGYGLQIGHNLFTAVSHDYETPFNFTGKLKKVTIEVKKGTGWDKTPVEGSDG